MEVLYETLIKIQLTLYTHTHTHTHTHKELETLPILGSLTMYWPHGQGEPATQTQPNSLNV